MKVQEIMTKEVVKISGSATVAEAVTLMKEKNLRALIVDRRNENDPYGIVSETDIVYKVAAYGHDPKKMRVYEIMTKPCVVVRPELGVEYAARLFANTGIRRAPVVDSELRGIVSVSDIMHKSDFIEEPKELFIEDRLEVAREEARTICAEKGATSPQCAAAWDIVEELQATLSHQRKEEKASTKTAMQLYCEENSLVFGPTF